MAWELVHDVTYPGYDTYRGQAIMFETEWTSVLDLWIDTSSFVSGLLTNITTSYNSVVPLESKVFRKQETWWNIPYWHYRMELYCHDSPLAPAIVGAILFIIQVAVVALAAWVILNSAKQLIWGPDEYTPGTPGQCDSGYSWDARRGVCIRTAGIPWVTIAALAGAVIIVYVGSKTGMFGYIRERLEKIKER